MSIEELLKSLKIISLRHGEDNVDRLHYFLTTNLLIAASTITAWKIFEGRAIECMSPTSFPNSWATFIVAYFKLIFNLFFLRKYPSVMEKILGDISLTT
ncbi:Innexin-11 [Dirofilaria immitis]